MKNIFITDTDSKFGACLAEQFQKYGYTVYSGCADKAAAKCDKLDYFADTTDFHMEEDNRGIKDGLDDTVLAACFRENVAKPLGALERLMPLLDAGDVKRIFYLSTADASVSASRAVSEYGRNMSKAALNNIMAVNRNRLRGKGYTFRVFDPLSGKVDAEKAAAAAYIYITRDRCVDSPNRSDENRFVMRDALGRECPW